MVAGSSEGEDNDLHLIKRRCISSGNTSCHLPTLNFLKSPGSIFCEMFSISVQTRAFSESATENFSLFVFEWDDKGDVDKDGIFFC